MAFLRAKRLLLVLDNLEHLLTDAGDWRDPLWGDVLATLAGPALLDMGVPLMVTHMIVFWYSQDANVTPPVSLASFAGAGVAGANPMRTAFTSWKLAKGLYIIPIIMAYRPLLGMGETYELFHWSVIFTMITTTLGLVAFAAAIERFLFRRATIVESILLWIATVGLLWPEDWVDAVGFVALAAAVVLQRRPGKAINEDRA